MATTTGHRAQRHPLRLRLKVTGRHQLSGLRERLDQWLLAQHVSAPERAAVILATDEAINNAILDAERSAEPIAVEVAVSLFGNYICIEVRDRGSGLKGVCTDLSRPPSQESESGRGLYLMRELMGSLELVPRSQGTLVRMTKRLSTEPGHRHATTVRRHHRARQDPHGEASEDPSGWEEERLAS